MSQSVLCWETSDNPAIWWSALLSNGGNFAMICLDPHRGGLTLECHGWMPEMLVPCCDLTNGSQLSRVHQWLLESMITEMETRSQWSQPYISQGWAPRLSISLKLIPYSLYYETLLWSKDVKEKYSRPLVSTTEKHWTGIRKAYSQNTQSCRYRNWQPEIHKLKFTHSDYSSCLFFLCPSLLSHSLPPFLLELR